MNNSKRDLVVVWTYLDWGGAQIHLLSIVKRAVAKWNVTVAMPRGSGNEIVSYIRETGANVEFLEQHLDTRPAHSFSRKLTRQWSRIKTEIGVYNFLRRFPSNSSVCHLEISPWQSWILLTLLAIRRLNVSVTLHNPPGTDSALRYFIWRCRMKFVTSLSKVHFFASNEFTKRGIRPLVNREAWSDIPVTYTAIDPDQIDRVLLLPDPREPLRKQFGIEPKETVVLTVGQFIDRKGRWVLLEAAQKLKEKHADLVFVWLSPVDASDEDKKKVDSYELGNTFRLIRSASVGETRDDVLAFFRIADIFVLPSFVEGLPIALLEAMAFGIPSISTSVYAIPEAIEDGVSGVLIEPGNVDALVDAIERLKNDPALRANLGAAGRTSVVREFDENHVADLVLAEYRRHLNG